jgi:hypothetical protein
MKKTKNIRVDILSKKLGYEKKYKTEDFLIFWKNRDNLILNKQ